MNRFFKFRIAGIFLLLALTAVLGGGVMLLWNALIPGIFGITLLNYWQAVGLLVLARILLGGIGGFCGRHGMLHAEHCRDAHLFHHRNALREKWMKMSEEERKAFLEKERDFMHFHRKSGRFHDFFDENALSKETEQS